MAKRDVPGGKTNACRALDRLNIRYEVRCYDFDPEHLEAERVAEKVGLPAAQVFKTLCVRGADGSIVLAVIPGDRELDLKRLAKVAGCRSVEPVAVKELQQLTGYVRGGVTALACKKPFPVFADEMLTSHAVVSISAGQRGMQILLAPADYVRATQATLCALARAKAEG
ncbi:MAG TPA: Cys-tRNA(Pro) deacylase [Polyangiaceae bacterium]|nr:Cys-tRNA(Pro) deacylase [Polyangiaceae bacterium]